MGNDKRIEVLKFIGNTIIKLILKADKGLKASLYDSLRLTNSKQNYLFFRNSYKIADSFRFNGYNILFYGDGEIVCGENSYIGDFSTIQSYKGHTVEIGDNCSISHNVRIYTASNNTDQDMNHKESKQKVTGDVLIGNGVWIGANVFINPGVIIGDNVVVGANSVVTKNLENQGVYGGVPAKLIRFKTHD